MNWQTDYPDEPGDWLWVNMDFCGCCVGKSGIAWITTKDELAKTEFQLPNKELSLSWERQMPEFWESKPCVTHWAKIDLPEKESK